MLPDEIDPFADMHRENLKFVHELLAKLEQSHIPDIGIPVSEIRMARAQVQGARHGFERFRVCMADEVRQKNLYRDSWLELRDQKK